MPEKPCSWADLMTHSHQGVFICYLPKAPWEKLTVIFEDGDLDE